MLDDRQLLRRYVADGSEAAFGELVARYLNLVYSAALRRTGGDTHLAQDVAQLVFTDLARKARSLRADVVLAGWLHRATQYAAGQLLRTEHRRLAREQEAVAMNAPESETSTDWKQIRPLLDEALDELGRNDRDALLLRFFEQRTHAEIGAALGSNEDAARKRVARALEKLRADLVRRGVTTTSAALSAALSVNAVQIAPAGLAATLTGASLAGAAAGGGTTLTLLKFITMTQLKTGIVSAIVVASVATSLMIQHQAQARLRAQDEPLRQHSDQLAQVQAENDRWASQLGQAGNSKPNSLDDLMRLRAETETLRKQASALIPLQEENRRLRVRTSLASNDSKTLLEQKEEGREGSIARLNYTKRWVLAFHMYAAAHAGRFPATFDQAGPYLPDETNEEIRLTPDQFEIVYQGSLDTLTNAQNIIVIRERQARQYFNGNWAKAYGFADGHSEIHSAPTDDFESFEKKHGIPPPNP